MKRLLALFALLALAGCVAPAPHPFVSPLSSAFDSPLAPMPAAEQSIYLPLYYGQLDKRGLSMDRGLSSCAYVETLGVSWYYDWSPQPLRCPGSEAVPMLWSPVITELPSLGEPCYLLVGNECDLGPSQCNTPPVEAAIWWHAIEERYPQCKLIGPNVSHLGLEWLLAWYASYVQMYGQPPRIAALGVHCYLDAEGCQTWINTNIELARQWTSSGQVWVTEWSTVCATDRRAEAEDLRQWLEANPDVARYAWYVARSSANDFCGGTDLFASDGTLTLDGQWYRGDGAP